MSHRIIICGRFVESEFHIRLQHGAVQQNVRLLDRESDSTKIRRNVGKIFTGRFGITSQKTSPFILILLFNAFLFPYSVFKVKDLVGPKSKPSAKQGVCMVLMQHVHCALTLRHVHTQLASSV